MFDDIRLKSLEKDSKYRLMLDIDQDDAFDYDTCTSEKFTLRDLQ